MEFSKIVGIEIINFMSIKKAKIVFDEDDIINLKGYNHSGKSAILKAVAVCLMNYKPKSQVQFIHHGQDYLRVAVSFDDGIVIVRDKYINGQSLYEMYKGKDLIYTTKAGNKLLRVDDVPDVIKEYLGLITTDRGYLNIQFRKDPLWLIDTKGSENYNDINEILRTVEISRAGIILNNDKNKLSGEITSIEADLQNAQLTVEGYGSLTEELLVSLSQKELEVQSLLQREEEISAISSLVGSISGIREVPGVEQVELGRVLELGSLVSTIGEILEIPEYPVISRVDLSQLISIGSLVSLISEYDGIDMGLLSVELGLVGYSRLESLDYIESSLVDLDKIQQQVNSLSKHLDRCEIGKQRVMDYAKSHGVRFVECENCGTLMEVKNEKAL